MVITKISEQQKNADRVNIFLDGKYVFSLTINQLIETKLKVGQEIDEASLKELQKISAAGKLKAQTLEWLLIRPRSRAELVTYLKKKKLDETESAELIRFFQSKGYQNDLNFARWWIEQRLNRLKSLKAIRYELRAKGIEQAIINEIFNAQPIDDKNQLKKLIDKKHLITKYPDKNKLAQYLLRQGFPYESIKIVLADTFGS